MDVDDLEHQVPSRHGTPRGHRRVIWRSRSRQLLVVTGLTGFAISQPVLSVLGQEPTILARYGIEGSELFLLAGAIALVPPLVLWTVSAFAGALSVRTRSPVRVDRGLHLLAVAALVGLFAVQVLKSLGLHGLPVVLLAGATGGGFVVAYVRHAVVTTWASYTAVLPFLAIGAFVLTSPASALRHAADAPERIHEGDLPSVVLVILDELPTRSMLTDDDQIDAPRLPNLAAFAEDATWYRHASSLATATEAAVPSLLTGKLPVAKGAVWSNHPDNLFTLLAPTHELEVIEQSTELCPYDVCEPTAAGGDGGDEALEALDRGAPGFGDLLGLARDVWVERVSPGEDGPNDFGGFDEAVTSTSPASPTSTTVDPAAPSVTARPGVEDRVTLDQGQALTSLRTDAMVEAFDAEKDPALYYLHLMIPHQPFKRYPDGSEYRIHDPLGIGLPREDNKLLFSWSPWTSAVSEQQHLLQAQYGDRLVGQILAGLREAGLYDDSLVIVASDHGISFEARTDARYVEPSSVDAIGYAPLLIKPPGQTDGAVDDTNVMSFDLLPTIAEIVGLDVTWDIDGAPIGSEAIAARGSRKLIYDMAPFGLRVRRVIEYDDAAEFGHVGDRFVGPLTDVADPLSALHERLGIAALIDRPLDDLLTGSGPGSVALDELADLRSPPGDPRLGLVTGEVTGASDDARLLLAVDGVVVGGSAMSTDSNGRRGLVAVLLPEGALDGDNDIRAALIEDDGEIVDLEVVAR